MPGSCSKWSPSCSRRRWSAPSYWTSAASPRSTRWSRCCRRCSGRRAAAGADARARGDPSAERRFHGSRSGRHAPPQAHVLAADTHEHTEDERLGPLSSMFCVVLTGFVISLYWYMLNVACPKVIGTVQSSSQIQPLGPSRAEASLAGTRRVYCDAMSLVTVYQRVPAVTVRTLRNSRSKCVYVRAVSERRPLPACRLGAPTLAYAALTTTIVCVALRWQR
jgi:hypothetical protein